MLLSKFFAGLFFPGLLLFLLLHPRYRRALARREPWLAVALALAVWASFWYRNAAGRLLRRFDFALGRDYQANEPQRLSAW